MEKSKSVLKHTISRLTGKEISGKKHQQEKKGERKIQIPGKRSKKASGNLNEIQKMGTGKNNRTHKKRRHPMLEKHEDVADHTQKTGKRDKRISGKTEKQANRKNGHKKRFRYHPRLFHFKKAKNKMKQNKKKEKSQSNIEAKFHRLTVLPAPSSFLPLPEDPFR